MGVSSALENLIKHDAVAKKALIEFATFAVQKNPIDATFASIPVNDALQEIAYSTGDRTLMTEWMVVAQSTIYDPEAASRLLKKIAELEAPVLVH